MEKIKATMVLEVLGRPAEHIKTALADLIQKLGAEQGIKISDKTIHEPSQVKESKDLYTTFAEISIEFDSLQNYLGIIFAYMPAHVEIISPTKVDISNSDLNDLGNKLLARLHDYDAIAKKLVYERNLLLGKLREATPDMFKKKELSTPADKIEDKVMPEAKAQKKKSKKNSEK